MIAPNHSTIELGADDVRRLFFMASHDLVRASHFESWPQAAATLDRVAVALAHAYGELLTDPDRDEILPFKGEAE